MNTRMQEVPPPSGHPHRPHGPQGQPTSGGSNGTCPAMWLKHAGGSPDNFRGHWRRPRAISLRGVSDTG